MAIEKTIVIKTDTKSATKDIKDLEKAVEGVNEEVKETATSSSELTGQLDNLTGGAISKFKAFKTSLKGVTSGFKTMRAAIISTGIGALIIAITSLIAAFRSSEEGQNKFAKLTSMIGTVVSVLTDRIADLGEGIINAFTNPVETIKNFAKSVKTFITDKINGVIDSFGLLGSAIKKAFTGDFSGALEDAKDGFVKLNESINPVAIVSKALVKSTKELVKEMKEEAKIAGQIADIRAEADKLDRKLIVDRAKADRDRATLLEQSVNKEKFSVEERIGFLQEAADLEEKITNQEIEAAQKRLDAQIAENALGKSRKEDKDAEAELEAKLIQLQTAKLTKQKEVTSQIIAFKAEEKAIRDAEVNEENARLNSIQAIRDEFAAKQKEKEAETELEKLALEEEKRLAELDKLNATEEQKLEILTYYAGLRTDLEEKENKKKEQLEKLRTQQTLGDAKNTFNQIANLAGKDSKVGKAFALASATISGVEGVQNAYSTAQKSPITAVFPAYPVVQAGLAAAVAAKNLAAIRKVDATGSGGASVSNIAASSGGGASQPPSFNIVGASDTNQLADAIGGQTQQPVQAYVVANDVTTAQSLENNIVEGATLG